MEAIEARKDQEVWEDRITRWVTPRNVVKCKGCHAKTPSLSRVYLYLRNVEIGPEPVGNRTWEFSGSRTLHQYRDGNN